MSYNSKYSGQQVENLLDQVANGNTGGGGSGGITTELDPVFSASAAAKITDDNISSWNNKVDKVDGKQLSTEDFTTLLKQKLDGLSNYDDTEISQAVSKLRTDLDTLVSGDTTTAIKTFNEVIAFLDGISDTEDLASIIASIEQQIAAKGTYTKPSNGIPKSDLASAVQTSLGKADTALQSVPSEYVTETELNNKKYATSSQLNAGFADTERKFATLNEAMDNKQPKLVSGTNIKTINGNSILGSGDIVIEGGSSGSCAYPVENHVGSISIISPNVFHVWNNPEGIDVYLGNAVEGVVNEYVFQFTYVNLMPPNPDGSYYTFPDTIQWANGEPNFEVGKTYQISIVNNIGLIVSV